MRRAAEDGGALEVPLFGDPEPVEDGRGGSGPDGLDDLGRGPGGEPTLDPVGVGVLGRVQPTAR
ncbi:MAG: hypothetical protein ACYCX8_07070 [Acidimicrobiales bacterium]